MSDPNSKSIPSWQRQETQILSTPKPADNDTSSHTAAGERVSRDTLLQQAAQFLEKEDIQDTPESQKIEFLEGKGLTTNEIHELLKRSDNKGASSGQPGAAADESSSLPSAEKPSSTPVSSQPSSVPPIITYPEFLAHAQRPPPLITTSRVLSTLYITSALAATIYGTSKYLLNPMLDTLTEARHSLFENASSNLDALNEKLENVVSVIPVSTRVSKSGSYGPDQNETEEDDKSDASDPTELFHRDTGTQTSPPMSISTSSSSLDASGSLPITPLSIHTSQMKSLDTELLSILTSTNEVVDEDAMILHGISDLREYLLEIQYGRKPGSSRGETSRWRADDEISKVKAEIRNIKGVLLSAKSFPGTGTTKTKATGS
ncbi:hypothetical protein MMC19_005181 [Ptychographa xylographoides]|nr:hypothetical protein [Ptychographa xylographoides]